MKAIENLLRPFAGMLPGRSVLAVGSELGTIETFLTANGASVRKKEMQELLTCKALKNANGIVDTTEKVDIIFWIGGPGDDILSNGSTLPGMITCLTSLMEEDGLLMMVHRNPTWLDRGLTSAGTGLLAGMMLDRFLLQLSLGHIDYYYIFPDHFEPAVLFCDRAFETKAFEVANLIAPNLPLAYAQTKTATSTRLPPWSNAQGRMKAFSGSFLIVASRIRNNAIPEETLAFSFNSTRTEKYNKMNVFYHSAEGEIMVRHIPYVNGGHAHDSPAGHDVPIRQDLSEERYLPGRLYSLLLNDIFSRPGWSVEDIRMWAEPWLALLKRMAINEGEWLDGRYVDFAPFNLLLHEGSLSAIDLEWIIQQPVPVNYVFFRGLYHCLARTRAAHQPAPGTPTNIFSLAMAIAEGIVQAPTALLSEFLDLEPRYFGSVFPGERTAPGDLDLPNVSGDDGEPTDEKHSNDRPPRRLYPLLNLNLQVFVETATAAFSEERSSMLTIGLSRERKVYALPLPYFTNDTIRLRVDPSDHSGLVRIHSLNLRTSSGIELFHWTPYSRCELALDGIVILNAAPTLPEPVMILLNYDPMLVFSLPGAIGNTTQEPVELEIELSALSESLFEAVLGTLRELTGLTP
jgi:hypothetical protein